MDLSSLRVIHLPTSSIASASGLVKGGFDALRQLWLGIQTCQRTVWVGTGELDYRILAQGSQVLSGVEAYRFLLGWALGLESQVVGEADIFGQIKGAWKAWSEAVGESRVGSIPLLRKVFPHLFEDVKDLRSQYLSNLGGSSYGTLTRKWLRAESDEGGNAGPLLMIGAGKLASSVVPFLLERDLWVWNRDRKRLESLVAGLSSIRSLSCASEGGPSKAIQRIRMILPEQEKEAWESASQIVICTPLDPEKDVMRVAWLRGRADQARCPVVHLGARNADRGVWNQLPKFATLDDLFGLQETLGIARRDQVERARKACRERAQLRALSPSLSVAHGWEDLFAFG